MSPLLLIAAIVAGWMVQMYLTYQQGMAFNRQVLALRRQGTVSVGVAGKRYRGGRAYVAIAVDSHGIVRNALTLTGFTTMARGKPLPGVFDVNTSRILSDEPLPGLSKTQHDAAKHAVNLARSHVPVSNARQVASA
jgi:DNA-binding transcriptional regulator of glucitol operon